ncbi:MAG: acyltransferase family protein [Clostridia bacterium]|nr:acyltransferase family protein [Clostridia bacterium]
MPKSDRRSLPSPQYAAAGDFMRVFCAFMIGWYHIWQQSWLTPTLRLGGLTLDFYPWVRAGYMFVDLMLLLSGFLLYLPWANGKPPETGVYLRRRAARILPGYWLALAVMLAFAVTAPDFDRPALLARDLGAHLAFVHNLFRFSYSQTRLNAVLWTLAVEVQFYLLLPTLAPLFNRRPAAVLGRDDRHCAELPAAVDRPDARHHDVRQPPAQHAGPVCRRHAGGPPVRQIGPQKGPSRPDRRAGHAAVRAGGLGSAAHRQGAGHRLRRLRGAAPGPAHPSLAAGHLRGRLPAGRQPRLRAAAQAPLQPRAALPGRRQLQLLHLAPVAGRAPEAMAHPPLPRRRRSQPGLGDALAAALYAIVLRRRAAAGGADPSIRRKARRPATGRHQAGQDNKDPPTPLTLRSG